MPKIKIELDKMSPAVVLMKAMSGNFNRNMSRGMRQIGAKVAKQVKANLRKYYRSDYEGRKFPSYREGRLWTSVYTKQEGSGLNIIQWVGPNTVYAATHEFGDPKRNIPKRAYVWPAWEKLGNWANKTIARLVFR